MIAGVHDAVLEWRIMTGFYDLMFSLEGKDDS